MQIATNETIMNLWFNGGLIYTEPIATHAELFITRMKLQDIKYAVSGTSKPIQRYTRIQAYSGIDSTCCPAPYQVKRAQKYRDENDITNLQSS